jgi:hypothetical protein
VLEGAQWASGRGDVVLSDELRCALPSSRLRWCQRSDSASRGCLRLPLYLNEARKVLVAEVFVPATNADTLPKHLWSQRGVCLVLRSATL